MDLTKAQEINLINSVKAYRASKARKEAAQKDEAAKFEKLKECSQGSGSPEQVLAKAYELLASCHMMRADELESMGE